MNPSLIFSKTKFISSRALQPVSLSWQRWYAAKPAPAAANKKLGKKMGKLGPVVEKKILPVESDPHKLVNYVCGSNIQIKGEDVKIQPDSEYPEWLWTIHTGPPKTLEALDPNTKQYWRKLRQMGLRRNNQLAMLKKF